MGRWIMNKITLILIGYLLLTGHVLQAQSELDPYLEKAAQNNPGLKAKFNQYLATLEKVPQVGTLPDPQVMFGVFVKPVQTRVGAQKANISLSQAFPWFGTLGAQERTVTQMAKADYEVFEDAKLRLFNDVKAVYYQLYYLEKAITITEENLRFLETFRQLSKVAFESGKSGFVDVLRVEMEWEDLNNQFYYLKDSRRPLEARFEALMNESLGSPIQFPDTLWTEEIQPQKATLIDSLKMNSPVLRKFDYEQASFASQEDVARRKGLPSFNVGFTYINIAPRTDMVVPGNGQDALLLPQVGVSVPLYREKYRSMVKESQIQQEAVAFNKKDAENKLVTDLEKVYRDYLDAQRRVTLFHKQTRYADQSLDLLTTAYSTDGKNFEEVIRMERRWLNYSLELEKARVEQNSFASSINYLIGK